MPTQPAASWRRGGGHDRQPAICRTRRNSVPQRWARTIPVRLRRGPGRIVGVSVGAKPATEADAKKSRATKLVRSARAKASAPGDLLASLDAEASAGGQPLTGSAVTVATPIVDAAVLMDAACGISTMPSAISAAASAAGIPFAATAPAAEMRAEGCPTPADGGSPDRDDALSIKRGDLPAAFDATIGMPAAATRESSVLPVGSVPGSAAAGYHHLPRTDHEDIGSLASAKPEGISPQIRSEAMTIDDFIPWIRKATPGRRQNLLDNVRLMKHFALTPDQLAQRGIDGVEALCKEYVRERTRNSMKWPAGMARARQHARATFHALAYMAETFPGQGFPDVAAPETHWLRGVAEDEQPATLKRELLHWIPRIRGQPKETGTGKSVQAQTPEKYRRCFWQYTAVVSSFGIDVNDDVTVELITDEKVLALVVPFLKEHFAAKSVPTFLTSIKRIVADLLGEEHPNVKSIAATMSRLTERPDLSADETEALRDATGLDAMGPDTFTIWELSEQIKLRSEETGLKPTDADFRLACALPTELCINHLDLTPAGLAGINLKDQVSGLGHNKILAVKYGDGTLVERPMTPRECDLGDALAQRRFMSGLESDWLFPARKRESPREVRSALAQLATNVEAVLGKRLTARDIRAARFIHEVDSGTIGLKQLSDAYGYKKISSAEARFRVALSNPLSKKEEKEDD